MNSFLSDAIQKIADMAKPVKVTLNDVEYATQELHLEPKPRTATSLELHTLDSVVQYWEHLNEDGTFAMVHVNSPSLVTLVGSIDERHRHQEHFAEAFPAALTQFEWGAYRSQRETLTELKQRFVGNTELGELLQQIGNIKHISEGSYSDDGISQKAKISKSVTQETNAELQKEWLLKPYRTFPEVDQPSSIFLLRGKSTERDGVQFALFETDGGQWKIDAIRTIAAYLRQRLPEGAIVLS